MMKRNRFLIGSIALLLLVVLGGVYKYTVLKDQRVELSYSYWMEYTVKVSDVSEETAGMYFPGLGLYLDERTSAGTVTSVKRKPAASGAEDMVDVTMTVSAPGLRLVEQSRGTYKLSKGNSCHFVSKFIEFDGKITQVKEG